MNKPPVTYTFEQKWGDDPFTKLHHTQVPNALIEYGGRVKLTPEECWLVACLLKFKHTPDDPFPSQERLAGLICQSTDTVRRLLKRIENKGLIHIEKVRGDEGKFTHTVYDFRPLRAALNECYYQDHPEERPATVQNCRVAKRAEPPRKTGPSHPAKVPVTTVQNCGPNKTLKRAEKEERKDAPAAPGVSPSALGKEEKRQEPCKGYLSAARAGKAMLAGLEKQRRIRESEALKEAGEGAAS